MDSSSLTHRGADIKVTWLSDDSQRLSLQTNQSLQRSTLVSDMFHTLYLAVLFVAIYAPCEGLWPRLSS